jgi:hypothetical protein
MHDSRVQTPSQQPRAKCVGDFVGFSVRVNWQVTYKEVDSASLVSKPLWQLSVLKARLVLLSAVN